MIVGIFGKTGMGKSTALKELIRRAPRVVVLDPLGKLGHLGVCVESLDEFKGYWRAQFTGGWKIILQPARLADTPEVVALKAARKPGPVILRAQFAPYLELAGDVAKRGCPPFLVAVDEVDAFGSAFAADPAVRGVADYGRNFGISLAFAARRPACVDRTLTSQCSTLYVFRITEPRDLEYFGDVIGRQAAAKLPSLARFHALCWRGSGTEATIVSVMPQGAESTAAEISPGSAIAPDVEKPRLQDPNPPIEENTATPPTQTGPVDLSECVILTLSEAATCFKFSRPHDFKVALLDSGELWHRRLARSRWAFRKADLPA
ncbi:hypothetical protein LCGC14_2250930 [marine sediment metagenome]|uniref:Uncharacterized protein n=1 Tax=marine sediment metagenome TaxID=412755 RepID=A0A0F9FF53_9ZZZZ